MEDLKGKNKWSQYISWDNFAWIIGGICVAGAVLLGIVYNTAVNAENMANQDNTSITILQSQFNDNVASINSQIQSLNHKFDQITVIKVK